MSSRPPAVPLRYSFYSDFEDFEHNHGNDDDGGDDKDDDEEEEYARRVRDLRRRMAGESSLDDNDENRGEVEDSDGEDDDKDDDEDEYADFKVASGGTEGISSVEDLISFATSG